MPSQPVRLYWEEGGGGAFTSFSATYLSNAHKQLHTPSPHPPHTHVYIHVMMYDVHTYTTTIRIKSNRTEWLVGSVA